MNTLPLSRSQNDALGSVEALVGQVADEFTQRLTRGEQPQIEEYAERYPQIAALLRPVLPALQWIRLPSEEGKSDGANPAPHAALTGCLGDFRIIHEIGRGGMGIVYEAEQISLNRRVALKVLPFAATLDPKQLQRFEHEAHHGCLRFLASNSSNHSADHALLRRGLGGRRKREVRQRHPESGSTSSSGAQAGPPTKDRPCRQACNRPSRASGTVPS